MSPVPASHSNDIHPFVWKGLAVVVVGGVVYWLMAWWSYPPAVEFDNLKYIQLLRTAVSSERSDWLDKVKAAVVLRVTEGKMSEREFSHFDRIIKLAESRNWKSANEACFHFEEAQLNRRRQSAPEVESHTHRHD